jgi:hypothetical protein
MNKVKPADKPGYELGSLYPSYFVACRSSNLPEDDASNVIVGLFSCSD